MALYECEHTTSDEKLKVATDNFPTLAIPRGIIVGALCFPRSQTGHIMSLFRHLVYSRNGSPVNLLLPGCLCAQWRTKLSSSIRFSRESMLTQMISLLYINYLSISQSIFIRIASICIVLHLFTYSVFIYWFYFLVLSIL